MNKAYLQPPSLVSALETEMYERTKVLAFPPTKQQVNDLSGSLLKRLFTFTPNCVPQIISYLPLPDSCNHSCICSDMHSYISSLSKYLYLSCTRHCIYVSTKDSAYKHKIRQDLGQSFSYFAAEINLFIACFDYYELKVPASMPSITYPSILSTSVSKYHISNPLFLFFSP